jgi:GT2 family glycosyltransferase
LIVEDGSNSTQTILSIIVLNFNGKDVLENCLRSVMESEYEDFEVIVVDNASTDESLKVVREFASRDSRVRLLQNSSNLGFCAGYNAGARIAKGSFLALVNNDTEFPSNSFKEIIGVMETDSRIGLCEGKILLPGNRVSYPGKRFNPIVTISNTDFFPEQDRGQYDRVHEIFSAGGVAPVVRTSVAKQIGLYDPDLWWTNDIEDLSWRVHLGGYRVVFVPSAVVHHIARLGGGWYKKDIRMRVAFHSTKNHLYVLLKNGSRRTLLKYVPVIVAIRSAELFYLFLSNKPDLFASKIRAHLWLLRHARHIVKERRRVQSGARISEKEFQSLMTKPDFGLLLRHYRNLISKTLS